MRRVTRATISLGVGAALVVASFASMLLGAARPAAVAEPTPTANAEQEAPSEEEASEPATDEREVFVATWGERIDAYNAGYPLEGYGRTFAEAAYDSGVDPRFSPAIARVESGSGANCTYAYNAWGWGTQSWSDWDSAIWGHVTALAGSYGRTLSWDAALSYNEENPDGWYAEVEAGMAAIWPDESL